MDNLPNQVLFNICSFLPWYDRIIARRLSSKFSKQYQWKTYLRSLILEEVKVEGMEFQKDDLKRFIFSLQDQLMIVIVKGNSSEKGITIRKTVEISEKDGGMQRKTTIYCPEIEEYRHFVDAYTEILFSHFIYGTIELINLSSHSLSMINHTRLKENVIPKTQQQWLKFRTNSNVLSTEAKNLLNISKENYSLQFSPPADFTVSADFWQLMPNLQLSLDFGVTCDEDKRIADVDMGITDDLIRELVKKRQLSFWTTSVYADISIDLIKEYIERAFLGEYLMYDLTIAHRIPADDAVQLCNWLRVSGFERLRADHIDHDWTKVVEGQRTRKGYDSDRVIVRICPRIFRVIADYECYRGKESVEHLLYKDGT